MAGYAPTCLLGWWRICKLQVGRTLILRHPCTHIPLHDESFSRSEVLRLVVGPSHVSGRQHPPWQSCTWRTMSSKCISHLTQRSLVSQDMHEYSKTEGYVLHKAADRAWNRYAPPEALQHDQAVFGLPLHQRCQSYRLPCQIRGEVSRISPTISPLMLVGSATLHVHVLHVHP